MVTQFLQHCIGIVSAEKDVPADILVANGCQNCVEGFDGLEDTDVAYADIRRLEIQRVGCGGHRQIGIPSQKASDFGNLPGDNVRLDISRSSAVTSGRRVALIIYEKNFFVLRISAWSVTNCLRRSRLSSSFLHTKISL